MKLIRIIIALLPIYLFIASVAFLCIAFVWFSRFSPDLPSNTIARVTTSQEVLGVSTIAYTEQKMATGLSTIFTRDKVTAAKENRTFTAKSETLFITYEKIKVDEKFVPLGFTSLYRVASVSSADGDILYKLKLDLIDRIMVFIGTTEKETISFLARPQATSYTVTISTQGVKQYEN